MEMNKYKWYKYLIEYDCKNTNTWIQVQAQAYDHEINHEYR